MLSTTKAIILVALRGDTTLTSEQQTAIWSAIQFAKKGKAVISATPIPRVGSRKDTAKILGVSTARVDQIKLTGGLKSVILPGCSRVMGFTGASVRAIAEGLIG